MDLPKRRDRSRTPRAGDIARSSVRGCGRSGTRFSATDRRSPSGWWRTATSRAGEASGAAGLPNAIRFRELAVIDATAFRLVHGEADRLPSLIVDRYGDYLVVQALSQAMDRLLPDITARWSSSRSPQGILARNDPRVRLLEGLEQRVEVLHGTVPETIDVREGAVALSTWIRGAGRRPGLFLDQRENRDAAARYARGRLLDCFQLQRWLCAALAPTCDETVWRSTFRRRPSRGS